MSKITAVITTFLRPATLPRAIGSVLAQSILPKELLIIDNASDQETEKLVSNFCLTANIPIRYIIETKRGVSAARNRGLKEATSEYVAFLDDDDVWLPHHLQDFLAIAKDVDGLVLFGGLMGRFGEPDNLILPDSARLFTDFVRVNNSEVSVRPMGPINFPFYTPSMSQSIVESESARRTLFDEDLPGREDIHFVWRMGQLGNIALHHKVHGFADQLETSLFSVMDNARAVDKLRMNLKKVHCGVIMLEKMTVEYPLSEGMKNARASAYFDSAYVNALAGNSRVACKHFFQSTYSGIQKKHFKLMLRIGASLLSEKVI